MGPVMLLVLRPTAVGKVPLANCHHRQTNRMAPCSLMVLTPFTSAEALGPGITQTRDAERNLNGYEALLYHRSN